MNEYMKQIQWKIAFNGRISRKTFWTNWVFLFVLGILVRMIPFIGQLAGIYISVWGISLAIRRLHDIGKRGWWCLVPILNLIYFCKTSQPGENQWGVTPQEGDNASGAAQ